MEQVYESFDAQNPPKTMFWRKVRKTAGFS